MLPHPPATIGVCAPSSYVERTDIEKAAKAVQDAGYAIQIHPQTFARDQQSAGTRAEKLDALHALYADDTVDAIWAAGGGNRAMDLLNSLDYDLIRQNPKPLIGFSDTSCLLNAIYAHTGQIGFHAPVFRQMHQRMDILQAPAQMPLDKASIVTAGKAQGAVIGGCLSLFHLLPGTPACPDLDGAILFLEDTGDQLSRFDRMLLDLKHKNVFSRIAGLVLGEFHDLQDGARPFGFNLEECARNALDGRDIPVIINAPFGHGTNNHPFPIGGSALLNTDANSLNFEL